MTVPTAADKRDPVADLVVQHPALTDARLAPVIARLGHAPDRRAATIARWRRTPLTHADARALGDAAGVDANLVVAGRRLDDFGLLAFDMDSTLITVECIDELADYAGRKAEVAAITDAAMRGEIADYTESLRQRLAVLEGLPETVLEQVYLDRIRVSPGAIDLLAGARAAGLSTLLVSGGFTWFTDRLATELGIDATRANRLQIVDGRLTGRLAGSAWGPDGAAGADGSPGPIVDAAVKHRTLVERCAALGITPAQAIVCGDGSNDLPMLEAAGLGVAWRAKPIVRHRVAHTIDHGGLDSVLGWFGD